MSAFIHWTKFNLVGVMGMAVQLTTLTLLNRLIPGHYLYATAAAIEVTLMHNFLWHIRYTWRDRPTPASRLRQVVHFHLSNGLISLSGNLILMRILVHGAHLPVVRANIVAILCCSTANFCLSHLWIFAKTPTRATSDSARSHRSAELS